MRAENESSSVRLVHRGRKLDKPTDRADTNGAGGFFRFRFLPLAPSV